MTAFFSEHEIRTLLEDEIALRERLADAAVEPVGKATQILMSLGVRRAADLLDAASRQRKAA